eukprot:scaffold4216_cov43-Phaeocystis_antarctica.AAC.4
MLPKEAVVDASKPAVKPPGQRRFEAAEGALQVRYLVITPRGASRPQRAPRCRWAGRAAPSPSPSPNPNPSRGRGAAGGQGEPATMRQRACNPM